MRSARRGGRDVGHARDRGRGRPRRRRLGGRSRRGRAPIPGRSRLPSATTPRAGERFGSASQLLEPELKEGSGGWRDVHSIWLLEAAIGSTLDEAGLLRGREREALAAAEEFLTRVRSALHLETGKRTDRLVLDHQPAIARAMGFEDEPRLIAIDGLMRATFEHARQIEFLLRAVMLRFLEEGSRR